MKPSFLYDHHFHALFFLLSHDLTNFYLFKSSDLWLIEPGRVQCITIVPYQKLMKGGEWKGNLESTRVEGKCSCLLGTVHMQYVKEHENQSYNEILSSL